MTDLLLPPPPASPPPPTRGDPKHPGLDRRRALPALLAAGLAFDAVVWAGPPTLAGALALVVVAAAVLVAGRTTTAASRLLAAGAVGVALWLPVRTSPWLVPVDVLVAGGLLVLAASFGREGRLRDLTFGGALQRGLAAPVRLLQGPGVLRRTVTAGWRRRPNVVEGQGPAVVRGLLVAVPVVAALAALLASADAVFASFFRIPLSPGDSVVHVLAVAAGVLLVLPLLLEAVEGAHTEPAPSARLGTVETTVVLVGVVGLYAAFAAAQVVAAVGGADHVLDT
ncbi:MAG TPA: DUF4153 domain-containing protein, partial [Acidimicrobiales bacterium]|nr:DUF4153 domain-containing protein [Acidimicrobiales bacterium]